MSANGSVVIALSGNPTFYVTRDNAATWTDATSTATYNVENYYMK